MLSNIWADMYWLSFFSYLVCDLSDSWCQELLSVRIGTCGYCVTRYNLNFLFEIVVCDIASLGSWVTLQNCNLQIKVKVVCLISYDLEWFPHTWENERLIPLWRDEYLASNSPILTTFQKDCWGHLIIVICGQNLRLIFGICCHGSYLQLW